MTQRIILSLFVSCALVVGPALFVGCDNTNPDAPDPVLLPLDVGNQWVMAFTRFDAEGTLTDSDTDTLRVVGDTTVAGERWAEIQGPTPLANTFLGGFYTNRDDGVWKWEDPSSDEPPYLLYKYPADVGDTYELPGTANFTVTVLGTDEPFDTPAGTLSAYLYELDTDFTAGYPVAEGAGRFERYLVPGQGFAFFECAYLSLNEDGELDSPRRSVWELITFEDN